MLDDLYLLALLGVGIGRQAKDIHYVYASIVLRHGLGHFIDDAIISIAVSVRTVLYCGSFRSLEAESSGIDREYY